MGHSETVLWAKLGSGTGPTHLQYKVRTKDGLPKLLELCRILEANTSVSEIGNLSTTVGLAGTVWHLEPAGAISISTALHA